MDADRLLIDRVRAGSEEAWAEFIARYEGRLLAFAHSRLRNRARAEDVVQEAFLGFLVSLPNYDPAQSLEAWLFAITAHKLTDALRREGRRPTVPLFPSRPGESSSGTREPAGRARVASSLARSREGRDAQAALLEMTLRDLVAGWKANGEWERLMCGELLFVVGLPNKEVAARLDLTEQAVANHKYFIVSKLKAAAKASKLRDADLKGFGLE